MTQLVRTKQPNQGLRRNNIVAALLVLCLVISENTLFIKASVGALQISPQVYSQNSKTFKTENNAQQQSVIMTYDPTPSCGGVSPKGSNKRLLVISAFDGA